MASEYERRAWANLGPALGQVFQNYAQQKSELNMFKAQMALREKENAEAADRWEKDFKAREKAAQEEQARYDEALQHAEDEQAGEDNFVKQLIDLLNTGTVSTQSQVNPTGALENTPENLRALANKVNLPEDYTGLDLMKAVGSVLPEKDLSLLLNVDFSQFEKAKPNWDALTNELNFAMIAETPYDQLSSGFKKLMTPEAYKESVKYNDRIKEMQMKGLISETEYNTLRNADLQNKVEGKGIYASGYGGGGGGSYEKPYDPPPDDDDDDDVIDWRQHKSDLIQGIGLQDDVLANDNADVLQTKKRSLLQERTAAIKANAPDGVITFINNYLTLIDKFIQFNETIDWDSMTGRG